MSMVADPLSIAQVAGFYADGQANTGLGVRAQAIAGSRAERRVRREITSDGYDDIEAAGPGSDDFEALKEAESLIVAYIALPRLNLRLTEKGGLQRRTGVVDNENDLMSKAEMDAYREDWLGEANDLLAEIAPDEATGTDPVFAL